jgi:hypothetical protein
VGISSSLTESRSLYVKKSSVNVSTGFGQFEVSIPTGVILLGLITLVIDHPPIDIELSVNDSRLMTPSPAEVLGWVILS